jgi:hypothetical protein
VGRARHQLLPGAALARHEHARGAPRRAPHELEDAAQGLALRHDGRCAAALAKLRTQVAVLTREPRVLECTRDQRLERLVVEGLLHVVEGAEAHGAHRGVDRGVSGEHDHGDLGIGRAHPLEHRDPVEARHLEVGEQQVEALGGEGGESSLGLLEAAHVPAEPAQHHLEDRHHACLVVQDRDARDHAAAPAARRPSAPGPARGSTTSKHAPDPRGPAPAPGTTRIAPPWARAMRSTMARPRPVPLAFVV